MKILKFNHKLTHKYGVNFLFLKKDINLGMGFEVTKNEWRDLKFEPSKMPRDTNSITRYFANLD